MDLDWLLRIAPHPRPSLAGTLEEHSFTGRAFQPSGWAEPRRIIYDHQLVLIRSGTFRIEIEADSFLCPEGTFLIIPPGRWETSWNAGQTRGLRCWCHFDWVYQGPWGRTPIMTYFPAPVRAAFLRPPPRFVDTSIHHGLISSPGTAFDLFDRFLQRQNLGDRSEQAASRSVLLELLLLLLDHGSRRGPRERSVQLAEAVRQRLKAAVEAGRPVESIQTLLAQMNCSYAHLSRLFRAEYGISPVQYVHALRIDQAKLLLRDTALSVSEVGYRVGVADAGYFARLFRKVTKLTPSEFREGRTVEE